MLTPHVHTEVPGPRSRALMPHGSFDMQAIYRALVADDTQSQGCYLVDVDGNTFLDLFSHFALGALGYNHPALIAAAHDPAFVRAAINPTSTPFVTTEAWFDFMQTVQQRFAPPGMQKMFCVDGGGEGVEAAIKAAFIVFGEQRRLQQGLPADPLKLDDSQKQAIMDNLGTDAVILGFSGAFHGRGLGPLSATHSKLIHKADLPAFPWPMATFPANKFPREKYAAENEANEAASLQEVERLLEQHNNRVAAILVEPMQSEGGDRHASPAFFQKLQSLAKQAGAALILDEVQTGVAISGTMWAHEQLGLATPPDLVTFGKKMNMGGFFSSSSFDIKQFGRMYQTRNGDRARAHISKATLSAIASDKLIENVRSTGAYFLQRLRALEEKYPIMSQARGMGFLLAFDMPSTALRDEFLKRSMHKGVFATYTGVHTVRIRPYLITTPHEVDIACDTFDAVLREMSA